MTSEEIKNMIEETYLEVLKRPADKIGLNHWLSRINDPNDPLNSKEGYCFSFKIL